VAFTSIAPGQVHDAGTLTTKSTFIMIIVGSDVKPVYRSRPRKIEVFTRRLPTQNCSRHGQFCNAEVAPAYARQGSSPPVYRSTFARRSHTWKGLRILYGRHATV
jgi:hypothetical protein